MSSANPATHTSAPPSLDSLAEFDAERSQSVVRLIVAVVVIAYIGLRWLYPLGEAISNERAMLLVAYYVIAFMAVATLLHAHIARRPGHLPGRRLFAMTLDYSSLSFTLIIGGEPMLPLFALVLWVTVGNGLRYGRRYLLIAFGMAQATIAIVTWFTPYWSNHPNLALTLALSALIVPAYAYSLLLRMEEARQAALTANTAKSRFLAQASHDLRQPVHAIGLFIASLRQTKLNGAQLTIVNRIDRSLQGVARLFRSLLDISTLDSGAVSPKLEPVALGELFQELGQQNNDSASWAGCQLRFVATQRVVMTDRALLATILQNLITNALKHAPGRSVLVGCRSRGDAISIQVADTGPGIAAEHLPHLREEFYQVRKLGEPDKQGVGLGLAIVDRLVKLMGLGFEIRSEVDKGTSITINGLPIVNLSQFRRPPPLVDHRHPLKSVRILLIEDDADVLEATADLLASWGCVVETALGMPEIYRPVDLIIADFDIGGGITGADCIANYRRKMGSNTPAIIMTGHDEARIADLVDDPSIPILKKPIRPAELRSMVSATRMRRLQSA
jgi:signal transduction histidine kinase